MLSLFESGLTHVLAGDTGIEELLRVVDVPMADSTTSNRLTIPGAAQPRPSDATPAMSSPTPRKTPPPSPTLSPSSVSGRRPAIDLSNAFELLDAEEDALAAELSRRVVSRGSTVLLVDDEDTLRRVMKDLLVRDGFDVVEARTGAEALDQTDRHAPDIIVLDLNLPGMDGYAVLSELRSRPTTKGIPVIVLTAKGDEDNEVRVFELGADDFLTKPFRAKALTKRLEVLLARKKA